MIFFPAQIESAVKGGTAFVDHAAAASDRWLFLAALVALLVFTALVIFWLVKSLEKKAASHVEERKEWKEEREREHQEHKAERKTDQAEFLAALGMLKTEIKEMTEEVKKNTDVLTRHDNDMRAAHAVETRLIVEAELKKYDLPHRVGT